MTEGEKSAYEVGKIVGENIGLTKGLKIATICVVIVSILFILIK